MEPEGSLLFSHQPSMTLILSHMNPVHIFTPYFFKLNLNIILPPTPRYPNDQITEGKINETRMLKTFINYKIFHCS
jgi:hypothetical protein